MDADDQSSTVDEGLVVLEIMDKATKTAGIANDFVVRPISASEAFRRYSWLKSQPALNKSGNLRGMVINARMRTVYMISEKAGKKIAVVAALVEICKEMKRIEIVLKSDKDATEKTSRILLLGSAALLRSVTSIVPTAVNLLSMSAQGYAELYSLATGSPSGKELSAKIGQFDKQVTMIHQKQWDGETWYNMIEATVY